MPTAITLPSCLMDCYKVIYPELDFSRVGFYSGLPSAISLSGPDGFTMASGAASPDIRVYIKDYKPCGEDTFLDIAHELVHVIQIQGMLGGGRIPGSWAAYYMSQYLGCARSWSTCNNALEKEAYDFANGDVAHGDCGTDGKVRDFVDMVRSAASLQLHQRALAGRQPNRRTDLCRGAAGRQSRQDRERRRADLVLPAQLAPIPDRRRLLDFRVQQPRWRDRRGAWARSSAGFSEA